MKGERGKGELIATRSNGIREGKQEKKRKQETDSNRDST